MDLLGRYRIEGEAGRGAMGVVYRALDPEIGRRVAVKVLELPPGIPEDKAEVMRRRFLREARAAGALSHPGIIAVHDAGKTPDGRPYLVMELAESGTLASRLSGDRPDPAEVLRVGADLARALGAAHAAGIVHRDVKPANVLFGADGRARLADFGIARLSESELTRDGAPIGSPAYMAPEQLRGDRVDARADLYSLAATLYAWLTGRAPHAAPDLRSLLYRVAHEPAAAPSAYRPGLPKEIDAFFLRALSREPEGRPGDAGAFAAEAEALLAEPTAPSPSRRRAVPWGLAAGLALLALVGAGLVLQREDATGAPAAAVEAPSATVRLVLRHRLKEGRLEVRVDDRLAASVPIAAERTRARVFGRDVPTLRRQGEVEIPLDVASGSHRFDVAVVDDDGDRVAAWAARRIPERAAVTLEAELERFPRRLSLSWR